MGLLVLIAVLHIIENLVQSTIRILKILAIAVVILLRIKATTSGAKYLCKGLNLVLTAAHPATDAPAVSQDSLELSLWLALAKRARDAAVNTFFNRILPSSDQDLAGSTDKEPPPNGTKDASADQTATADGMVLD